MDHQVCLRIDTFSDILPAVWVWIRQAADLIKRAPYPKLKLQSQAVKRPLLKICCNTDSHDMQVISLMALAFWPTDWRNSYTRHEICSWSFSFLTLKTWTGHVTWTFWPQNHHAWKRLVDNTCTSFPTSVTELDILSTGLETPCCLELSASELGTSYM